MKDKTLKWRVHTPNLLKEIVENNPTAWTLRTPVLLFRQILTTLAECAIRLDNPELNVLMLRLQLYDVEPDKLGKAIEAQEERMELPKMTFEQDWMPKWLDVEDGGAARIYPVGADMDATSGMEVRLHSYDESLAHTDFRQFEGKRLRVTIEVIE